MNKKLVCLALSLLMLFSVFLTGCSQSSEEEEETNKSVATLTMHVVTERKVYYDEEELSKLSEAERAEAIAVKEQYDAVAEEINLITKAKFKTQLNIFYYTEDEYYNVIENKFIATETNKAASADAQKEFKNYSRDRKKEVTISDEELVSEFVALHPEWKDYITTAPSTDSDAPETEEETVTNELGQAELKYPEAKENQVDILFIGSRDKYLEYVEKQWLCKLNDELSGSSKKLKSYISPILLSAVTVKNAYYGIPNNTILGEYKYLLLNKELLAKYHYDASSIHSLGDCANFISEVMQYEPDYVALKGGSNLEVNNMFYWSIDPDTLKINPKEFSIVGASITSSGIVIPSLPLIDASSSYKSELIALKNYELNGFLGSEDDPRPFATAILKGGAELEKIYADEYEMVVLEEPRADEDDLFAGMFAVGAYTSSLARSMEIITYLNTNESLRNALQYGVEGENYYFDDEGLLVRYEKNLYSMDIEKTGNVFIAYPEEGMDPEIWEYGKRQNRDAIVAPAVGFAFTPEDDLDIDLLRYVQDYSAEVKQALDSFTTLEEFEAYLDEKISDMKIDVRLNKATQAGYTLEEGETGNSPAAVYYQSLS